MAYVLGGRELDGDGGALDFFNDGTLARANGGLADGIHAAIHMDGGIPRHRVPMVSDVVVGDDAVQDGIRGGPLAVGLLGERGVPDVERG